jgi:ubiquinone/menaquinone biosynthesis C-methylase UbiE/predicted transcriptional regulator
MDLVTQATAFPRSVSRESTDSGQPTVFERLNLLADTTRSRLLLCLEDQELTVSELTTVLQLPQSTVSRHLKTLGDDGWVACRKDGTSRLYRATLDELGSTARQLWALVRGEASEMPQAGADAERLTAVLAERRSKSQEFFSSAAGRWDLLRRELFGERGEIAPLLGLLDPRWTVGDLGCGTGRVSEALAPFVRRVVAVDDSQPMLAIARERLAGRDLGETVELRRGRLEALPVEDGELDVAVLSLVLHHLPEPARALAEVGRVLRPGGRVLVVDMQPHDREDYRREMGHVWLGLPAGQLTAWLEDAGLEGTRVIPLTADVAAQGPPLFTATARKAD